MADHYITIDAQGRIVAGFTTADHMPGADDIFLHAGGDNFTLFGRGIRPLSLDTERGSVWLYAYEGGRVRYRTKEEIAADLPPIEPERPIAERLADTEADIATLVDAINILLGVGG